MDTLNADIADLREKARGWQERASSLSVAAASGEKQLAGARQKAEAEAAASQEKLEAAITQLVQVRERDAGRGRNMHFRAQLLLLKCTPLMAPLRLVSHAYKLSEGTNVHAVHAVDKCRHMLAAHQPIPGVRR